MSEEEGARWGARLVQLAPSQRELRNSPFTTNILGLRAKALRPLALLAPSQRERRNSPLTHLKMWVALCFLVVLGAVFASASGQNLRVIEGRAVGSNEQPLQNAIVYLQDQKTLEVKTYITGADGKFRFGQLSSDVDYQLWTKYQNRKSKTKSISSFDSKTEFDFDLKVDTPK